MTPYQRAVKELAQDHELGEAESLVARVIEAMYPKFADQVKAYVGANVTVSEIEDDPSDYE